MSQQENFVPAEGPRGAASEGAELQQLTIALTTPDYPPDPNGTGIGTYSKLLAEGLVKRGHRVHVLTRDPGIDRDDTPENITMHRIPIDRPDVPLKFSWPRLLRLTASSAASEVKYRRVLRRKLNGLIEEHGVQLVEAADAEAQTYLYRGFDHPSVPYIVRLHGPLSVGEIYDQNLPEVGRVILREFERRHILGASHITVPAKWAGAYIRDEMRLGNRPIRVIPNPPPQHRGAGLSEGTGESAREAGLVLFVGRVSRTKGIDVLVEAIPKILARRPEARFQIVGADNARSTGHASTFAWIRDSLSREHLAHVELVGHVEHAQIDSFYQRASVCVFPSLYDTFSYTCLEAMSHGCAIVGSRHSGMSHMLDGGRAGKLYDPPDADDLAGAITDLLADGDLRVRHGRRARARAVEVYGEDVVFDQVVEFYRQAIRDAR